MINYLQNPRPSVFLDKQCFDSRQNEEILALELESISTNAIIDTTLQALGFHISTIGYLEKRIPRFTDVTNLELNTKLDVVDNPVEVVMDSKEEMVKKKNKRVIKRKKQLVKLFALVRSPLPPCSKFSLILYPLLCLLL